MRKGRINKREILTQIRKMMELALTPGVGVEAADRYVELARRISMRSRVRIPKTLKVFICHGCKRTLLPGITARFRVRSRREKHISVTCLRCGHIYRQSLSRFVH